MTTIARATPEELRKLYDSILATATGEQVASVGHKGRNASYNGAALAQQVKLFRSLWYAESGVPNLPADLEASMATRGCLRLRLIG